MSPSSCCELWGGCHGCIELSRVQITEILVGQDIGKADHRVQWRSQLVRDIGNEFALQAAGCFKCVVALAQYPFVLRRVSHIEVGQQHVAVGKRDNRLLQNRAVISMDRAGR